MPLPPVDESAQQPGAAVPGRWRGWPEIRADLRTSVRVAVGLALAGVPAGLLWWLLAPRADFRITDAGPVVVGNPSEELLVGDDVVYTLVLAGLGLLAGAAAWWLRRRRGVATVLALAVGALVAALIAWQVGELLGAGPTKAELAHVGGRVTTRLRLGGLAALAVAPFMAVLAYLVPAVAARGDDLGREPESTGGEVLPAEPAEPGTDERALVDVPPPGRPQA
jgi:LPXTG-motif cell wall-anchored protein